MDGGSVKARPERQWAAPEAKLHSRQIKALIFNVWALSDTGATSEEERRDYNGWIIHHTRGRYPLKGQWWGSGARLLSNKRNYAWRIVEQWSCRFPYRASGHDVIQSCIWLFTPCWQKKPVSSLFCANLSHQLFPCAPFTQKVKDCENTIPVSLLTQTTRTK